MGGNGKKKGLPELGWEVRSKSDGKLWNLSSFIRIFRETEPIGNTYIYFYIYIYPCNSPQNYGGWRIQNLHDRTADWRPREHQLESKGSLEAEFSLFRGTLIIFSLRPLNIWMRPTPTMKGNIVYFKYISLNGSLT